MRLNDRVVTETQGIAEGKILCPCGNTAWTQFVYAMLGEMTMAGCKGCGSVLKHTPSEGWSISMTMRPPMPPMPDYLVSGGGSVYLITPQNERAKQNLISGTSDDAQWLGHALAVEHRYISDLVDQLKAEGWTVV